jgi:uncharacterized protein (TIGR02596 family)
MDEMTFHRQARGNRADRGFTLIELLTVMAIISILAMLSVMAASSARRGSNLRLAGQLLGDQFSLAWQEAVSKNSDVEVRFYQRTTGGTTDWRGVQLWRIKQTPDGPVASAYGRVTWLPEGVRMSDAELSPLIQNSPRKGTVSLPTYGTTSYKAFRFRANGSLETAVGDNNFITLVNATDTGTPPANYYTIQINSLTGKTSVFRP